MTLPCPSLLPSLFVIIHEARRNVVLAPGRILGAGGLVSEVLVRPASMIVEPRAFILVPQPLFSERDVVD
jgi:hypothetical protein